MSPRNGGSKIASPSPVLHISGLPKSTTTWSLHRSLMKSLAPLNLGSANDGGKGNGGDEPIPPVTYVVLLADARPTTRALVEFSSIDTAIAVQKHLTSTEFSVKGHLLKTVYSVSQAITRPEATPSTHHQNHHTLLLSIHNPLYSVRAETLHKVCENACSEALAAVAAAPADGSASSSSEPLVAVARIVVFLNQSRSYTRLQALVEFSDSNFARVAHSKLHGASIYSGCCTIDAGFSPVARLKVQYPPTAWQCDFTITEDSVPPTSPGSKKPRRGSVEEAEAPPTAGRRQNSHSNHHRNGSGGLQRREDQPPVARGPTSVSSFGSVVMFRNVPAQLLDCEIIYNLLSVFSRIRQITLPANAAQAAAQGTPAVPEASSSITFVQAMTPAEARGLRSVLDGKRIHGAVLAVSLTSMDSLRDPTADYSNHYNNRSTLRRTPRRPPTTPCRTLYIWNVGGNTGDNIVLGVLEAIGITQRVEVAVVHRRGANTRHGLVEFGSVDEALRGAAALNNRVCGGHTWRVAFSKDRIHSLVAREGTVDTNTNDMKSSSMANISPTSPATAIVDGKGASPLQQAMVQQAGQPSSGQPMHPSHHQQQMAMGNSSFVGGYSMQQHPGTMYPHAAPGAHIGTPAAPSHQYGMFATGMAQ